MRTMAIIAGVGIVLGVALAFVLHAVRRPVQGPKLLPCTAEWLHLAPTVGLDATGQRARVGFTAPGPARCVAPGRSRAATVEVASDDGEQLVRETGRGGPAPRSAVGFGFHWEVDVPALKLCKARQPLHFKVTVTGLTATGTQRMRYARGRCFLGS